MVWWKCRYGHSWQKSVCSRTKNKSVCPYCTGRSVIKGYNDLKTKRPDLAMEWDYSLNNGSPDEIHYNNQTEQIHWICKACGYKWIHTVSNRNRCPECLRQRTQINVFPLDFWINERRIVRITDQTHCRNPWCCSHAGCRTGQEMVSVKQHTGYRYAFCCRSKQSGENPRSFHMKSWDTVSLRDRRCNPQRSRPPYGRY